MINILIISTNLADGGMQRQLSVFLQNHNRKKLNITLALLEKRINYNVPDDITIIDLKRSRRLQLSFYLRLFKLLSDSQYHVINSKISGLNELVMVICGILRKKNLIVEIRSSGDKLLPFYKRMGTLSRLLNIRFEVVCNNQKAAREIKRYISKEIKIHYIPNGININEFRKIAHTNTSTNNFNIGYVGRIAPPKNVELLISSLSRIDPDARVILYIIGKGTDKYETELKSKANKLGMEGKIIWINDDFHLVNLYNSFDLFVLPSITEGSPNALLEAMSCECVCLVSHGANTDYFLNKKFAFNENDPNELANKINGIQKLDRLEKISIGQRNRDYVVKNYSVRNMVNAMTDLYFSIVRI